MTAKRILTDEIGNLDPLDKAVAAAFDAQHAARDGLYRVAVANRNLISAMIRALKADDAVVADLQQQLAVLAGTDTVACERDAALARAEAAEAAEAFRASVPWDAINAALALIVICTAGIEQRLTKDEYEVVSTLMDQALIAGEWYQANAQQPAQGTGE